MVYVHIDDVIVLVDDDGFNDDIDDSTYDDIMLIKTNDEFDFDDDDDYYDMSACMLYISI